MLLRQQTLTTPLLRVATDEVFIIEGAAIDAFATSIHCCTPKPAYIAPGCSLQSKHPREKDSVIMTVWEEKVRCRQFFTVCHWDSSPTTLSYGPSPLLNWKSPVWIMKFLTLAKNVVWNFRASQMCDNTCDVLWLLLHIWLNGQQCLLQSWNGTSKCFCTTAKTASKTCRKCMCGVRIYL